MKTLVPALLAAAVVVGTIGATATTAAAQPGYYRHHGYRHAYVHRGYYGHPRYYGHHRGYGFRHRY